MFAFCHGPRTTTERRTLRPSPGRPGRTRRTCTRDRRPRPGSPARSPWPAWAARSGRVRGRARTGGGSRGCGPGGPGAPGHRRNGGRGPGTWLRRSRPDGAPASPPAAAALLVGLLLLLPGLVDHLLGEVGGDLLVVRELHRERSPAAGHRPEVDGVPGHLGLRGQGPDSLLARAGLLHAQDLAAL